MAPRATMHNVSNDMLRNTELASQLSDHAVFGNIGRSKANRNLLANNGAPVGFSLHALWLAASPVCVTTRKPFWMKPRPISFALSLSALAHTIGPIVVMSAQKQVCRVATDRVVAVVADAQVPVKDTKGEKVGNAVGEIVVVVRPEMPIAIAVKIAARPGPALRWCCRIHVIPKPRNLFRGHDRNGNRHDRPPLLWVCLSKIIARNRHPVKQKIRNCA